MGFNVNLSAVDYPEVASDTNPLTWLFLTHYCKALSRAFDCKSNFHVYEIWMPESRERLVIEYSTRLDTKQDIYSLRNKCPVIL